MTQFHAEPSRLDRIETAVIALDVVIILLRLAVIANHLHPLGHFFIVGDCGARFSARSKILARVETERRRSAHGAGLFPGAFLARKILCAMRLAGIFDHHQAVLFGQSENRIHVGGLAIEVNWNYCRNDAPGSLLDQLAQTRVKRAPVFQVLPQTFRIHGVGLIIDVHERDMRSHLGDGFGGCDKGVRYRDHDLIWLDVGRHECESQCIGSAVYADTVFGVAESGELPLKLFHHWTANKTRSRQGLFHYLQEFGLQFLMRRYQIKKRNFRCARHLDYFVSFVRNRKTLAGLPATMAFAGTSLVTTLPAPTIAFSPTVTLLRMVDPEPIDAPFCTTVFSTFQSVSVWRPPSAVVARG